MRALLPLLMAVSMQAAELDVEELVRRSVKIFEESWIAARDLEQMRGHQQLHRLVVVQRELHRLPAEVDLLGNIDGDRHLLQLELLGDLPSQGVAGESSAEREDVGVVVLPAVARRGDVMAVGGAHAGHLVGGHGRADAGTVDRWHPWLAVGEDGTVHVVFYDTRNDPTRTSVDMFWSTSTDGAVTWSTPELLTSEISPSINDGFDFSILDELL